MYRCWLLLRLLLVASTACLVSSFRLSVVTRSLRLSTSTSSLLHLYRNRDEDGVLAVPVHDPRRALWTQNTVRPVSELSTLDDWLDRAVKVHAESPAVVEDTLLNLATIRAQVAKGSIITNIAEHEHFQSLVGRIIACESQQSKNNKGPAMATWVSTTHTDEAETPAPPLPRKQQQQQQQQQVVQPPAVAVPRPNIANSMHLKLFFADPTIPVATRDYSETLPATVAPPPPPPTAETLATESLENFVVSVGGPFDNGWWELENTADDDHHRHHHFVTEEGTQGELMPHQKSVFETYKDGLETLIDADIEEDAKVAVLVQTDNVQETVTEFHETTVGSPWVSQSVVEQETMAGDDFSLTTSTTDANLDVTTSIAEIDDSGPSDSLRLQDEQSMGDVLAIVDLERQRVAREIDDALKTFVSMEEMQALLHEYKLLQASPAMDEQGQQLESSTDPSTTSPSLIVRGKDLQDSSTRRSGGSAEGSDTYLTSLLDGSQTFNNGGSASNKQPRSTDTGASGSTLESTSTEASSAEDNDVEEVDIAIVGGGLGALSAGSILNTLYGKKVAIYESHYIAGGCAHSFSRTAANGMNFTFDSGPTILLGSSSRPFNALQQVLDAVGQPVEWIPYDGWGMIENPGKSDEEKRWKVELGPQLFEEGPLLEFGGEQAVAEFRLLRQATGPLLAGAAIPAMAMRSDAKALVPLLRYMKTLFSIVQQGEKLTGTFGPYMDGPEFTVRNPWLRDWLDALAFSLSGLPAARTSAAAMAFIIYDMHRSGAALDYPKGGMGEIVNALVRGVEQGSQGSKVHLRSRVVQIDCDETASTMTGVTLENGKKIVARDGVICNAPTWSLEALIMDKRANKLLKESMETNSRVSSSSWTTTADGSSIAQKRSATKADDECDFFETCHNAEKTGSFLHLHLAINSTGLDTTNMEAHYTVMDRSLHGDGSVTNGVPDGPCGIANMIAVSNPCVIDSALAPEGTMVLHAYSAGNEPYELWEDMDRKSPEYKQLKEDRVEVLWRAVESIIPDVRDRVILSLDGSPLTHARFLNRPNGTYGSATEDYLPNGSTPFKSLVLANDGVFPGIGVPAVAIAGASAANAFVGVVDQWRCLDCLKNEGKI